MANEKEIQENRVSWEELRRKGKEREGKATVIFSFYDHICALGHDGDRLTDILYGSYSSFWCPATSFSVLTFCCYLLKV